MITDNTKEVLQAFIRKYKNYKPYDCDIGIVKKVFNRGMGALAIYRVYDDKRIIAVNKCLWNKTDTRKLEELKKMLGGDWRVVWCKYGYPVWYNHDYSLRYAINEEERCL